jgi:hypothetical protein
MSSHRFIHHLDRKIVEMDGDRNATMSCQDFGCDKRIATSICTAKRDDILAFISTHNEVLAELSNKYEFSDIVSCHIGTAVA